MESGVVTSENLGSILRGISQKRRNGILEISYPDRQVSALFNKGKVVEVLIAGSSPADEVVTLFKGAGIISGDLEISGETYSDIFRIMNESSPKGGAITEEMMSRVVKHRVLNHLYSLEMGTGSYYTFKVQMVEGDKNFAPSISTGQILLDLVSLESDSARFAATFPTSMIIERSEEAGALSEEEEIVYSCLATGGLTVDELKKRALLSRFHIQDTLLGMLERGVVSLTERSEEKATETAAISSIDDPSSEEAPVVEVETAQRSTTREGVAFAPARYLSELNNRLLQSKHIPSMVLTLFVGIALVAPFLFWQSIFAGF